jgi:citrate synthase
LACSGFVFLSVFAAPRDAALLLEAIGLPRRAFTPVFAIARAPSWIAHALEQQKTERMIRPRSIYIGPSP